MDTSTDSYFRPGTQVHYVRDHPLPDTDSDTDNSVEYYEEVKETASEYDSDEEDSDDDDEEVEYKARNRKRKVVIENEEEVEDENEDEDEDEEEDENIDNANTNANANVDANIPPIMNRNTPLVPFALAPGQVATNRRHRVICPHCPIGKNEWNNSSMHLHFLRNHRPLYTQYYPGQPPAPIICTFAAAAAAAGGCSSGPFQKQADLEDHLSEVHNVVAPRWRRDRTKQKRRKAPYLLDDHVAEAAALNALIDRIVAAEAALRLVWGPYLPYISRHGLPLAHRFETHRALVTDLNGTQATQKEDVSTKLVALRTVADQMGILLNGTAGTWEQVAADLEAHVAAGVGAVPVVAPVPFGHAMDQDLGDLFGEME